MTGSAPPYGPLLALLAGLCLPAAALAQESVATCASTAGKETRAYLDCLGSLQKTSELKLAHALQGAHAAITGHPALQPTQRKRWAALLEESQGRFIHWRNFECQSIAPYEGGAGERTIGGRLAGIGVLEQRLVCLISHSEARIADISRRYPPPTGWLEQNPLKPDTDAANAPAAPSVAPTGPMIGGTPRIIEITP